MKCYTAIKLPSSYTNKNTSICIQGTPDGACHLVFISDLPCGCACSLQICEPENEVEREDTNAVKPEEKSEEGREKSDSGETEKRIPQAETGAAKVMRAS